jgi:hypothetical protein
MRVACQGPNPEGRCYPKAGVVQARLPVESVSIRQGKSLSITSPCAGRPGVVLLCLTRVEIPWEVMVDATACPPRRSPAKGQPLPRRIVLLDKGMLCQAGR